VDDEELRVRVLPAPGGDVDELAECTGLLRAELMDSDVDSVDLVAGDDVPPQAKGLGGIVGWLAVRFGSAEGVRAVLGAIGGWCSRTNRSVEVSYGGDVLKMTGVTTSQQERIIDAWLARHATSS
jgi:hypothetical protein